MLRWFLKRSVKQTWTGSTFSTNESIKCTGHKLSVSCVWSGPDYQFFLYPFNSKLTSEDPLRLTPKGPGVF
jgi:hypothetical protein